MLDNNTNKVVWVGVAVGVVAIVGAGALTLFPDAFSSSHDLIRQKQLVMADGSTNVLATSAKFSDTTIRTGTSTSKASNFSSNTNFTLNLLSNNQLQGVWWGDGGFQSSVGYSDFLKGDDWAMAADIKVVSGDASKLELSELDMESSGDTFKWIQKPATLTNEYQHFESKGTRLETWGTPVIYFTNHSGQSVKVSVKNVTFHRV